jgi:low affinity Fe/Cu permease
MNINNKDYQQMKEKRDRAVRYWKDRVIQEFLPPIDSKKRNEINERVSKMKEMSNSKQQQLSSEIKK